MKLSVLIVLIVGVFAVPIAAQTTQFSYQGNLKSSGSPANGSFDFEFALYDAASGGAQVGSTLPINSVAVNDGAFTVSLNFGNQFPGAPRFLEVRVRLAGSGGFTTLAPRQAIASTPYAIKSVSSDTAATATNANQLGGVVAAQYVLTTDPRMTDPRPPTAGSASYIQNTSTQQTSSNFNISGTGTAGVFNAATQFNINGARILSAPGTANTFVGIGAGPTTTAASNTYVGHDAGFSNVGGGQNSFFGASAGYFTTVSLNSFFGNQSGVSNTTGGRNTFMGQASGFKNTSGGGNVFIGYRAGFDNTTGNSNTIIGTDADVASPDLTNATAIGSQSVASLSNSIFLGRPGGQDTVRTPGPIVASGAVSVVGQTDVEPSGGGYIVAGETSGANLALDNNEIMARNNGATATLALNADGGNVNLIQGGTGNVGIGTATPADKLHVDGIIRVATLGAAGSTSICRNSSNQISTCSSSLQYKTRLGMFRRGLDLLKQLKPITFDWKDSGMHDLGLGAEDVAAIEPLLVTYSESGQVEGVKYDRVAVVLINAVKELQAQITAQGELIKKQSSEIQRLQAEAKRVRRVATTMATGRRIAGRDKNRGMK